MSVTTNQAPFVTLASSSFSSHERTVKTMLTANSFHQYYAYQHPNPSNLISTFNVSKVAFYFQIIYYMSMLNVASNSKFYKLICGDESLSYPLKMYHIKKSLQQFCIIFTTCMMYAHSKTLSD